jgi:hypothetical protein
LQGNVKNQGHTLTAVSASVLVVSEAKAQAGA